MPEGAPTKFVVQNCQDEGLGCLWKHSQLFDFMENEIADADTVGTGKRRIRGNYFSNYLILRGELEGIYFFSMSVRVYVLCSFNLFAKFQYSASFLPSWCLHFALQLSPLNRINRPLTMFRTCTKCTMKFSSSFGD